LEQHRRTKPQLERAVQQADQEIRAAKQPIEQKQQEVLQAEGLLQNLERDKGNQMKAFSPQVHAVVRAIRNDTRFRDVPVGPMGFHVQLKKPEWASIIETTVGGNMDAFIVTNKQDQALLSSIMKKCNCHSNILIGSSRYIDVSQNEPEQGVDTILRIVEIDNDLVRNQLIINQRIEQTVLIRDRASGNTYAQQRKRNVAAVLSQHETQRGRGWRFDVTRGGSDRVGPIWPWTRAIRMKTSAEDQIRYMFEAVLS
jgi:chromosome segregation ATPase